MKSIKLSVHVLYGKIKRIQGVKLNKDVRHQLLLIKLFRVILIIHKLIVLQHVRQIWHRVVMIDQSIAKFIHAQKMQLKIDAIAKTSQDLNIANVKKVESRTSVEPVSSLMFHLFRKNFSPLEV